MADARVEHNAAICHYLYLYLNFLKLVSAVWNVSSKNKIIFILGFI